MTSVDIKNTIDFIKSTNIIGEINSACILSPTTELSYYQDIFKNISILNEHEWNLDYTIDKHYDIIIAHNIFYMAKTPNLWIDNVMESCNYFLLQDLLKRKRNNINEFCSTDTDNTRYSFTGHKYYDGNTFNLSDIKYKIINGVIYDGEANEYDSRPKHFACLIKR